ncbi:MAG: ABC transporter ATP-binding protein [Clostridiales bacterium]|nr:ABC transporter ATP-binding protein [Clostridiales bacterium]
MLEIKEAVLGYQGKQSNKIVLDGLSFTLERGELLCILGANGAGKTTMYRTVLGFLPLLGGSIRVDGTEIGELSRSQLARLIAYVPQYHSPPFPYSVFDVVLMGRSAHLQQFATPGKEDEEITYEMLERMGIRDLKDEVYTEISGGERQLVLIARALAQQSSYILMDEPASNLDYGNQMRMLSTIRELAGQGIGICFTSHYPTHAFLAEASVLAIEGKNEMKKGSAAEIITEELLLRMYGLDAEIRPVADRDGRTHSSILIHM